MVDLLRFDWFVGLFVMCFDLGSKLFCVCFDLGGFVLCWYVWVLVLFVYLWV